MDWFPKLPFGEGPRYRQIVAALENDIMSGVVFAGQRLPTHRDMAAQLGISVGTVSKAYTAAERHGLISGEVGRGTFVLSRAPELGVKEMNHDANRAINLALNAPPATGEDVLIGEVLSEISASSGLHNLLGYLPHQGCEDHRSGIADWLSRQGMPAEKGSVFITHGAQHAISIAMRLLARPGANVVTESQPYSGMLSLAQLEDYNLRGVAMDRFGLIPEKLDQVFHETGARVLYCTPTLQSTTGAMMPEERRRAIADILRKHDAYLVEDDAYGFLVDQPVPPLSSFLPERSFYIVSFAKCLSPGMRIGAMIAPLAFRDRCVNAIRSTGWMANAVMAEAVTRMIRDGRLEKQVELKRIEAKKRTILAKSILGDALDVMSDVPSFHIWMKMPQGRNLASFISQAAYAGVILAPPSVLLPYDAMNNGLRLCLGGANREADLRQALETLRGILNEGEVMSVV